MKYLLRDTTKAQGNFIVDLVDSNEKNVIGRIFLNMGSYGYPIAKKVTIPHKYKKKILVEKTYNQPEKLEKPEAVQKQTKQVSFADSKTGVPKEKARLSVSKKEQPVKSKSHQERSKKSNQNASPPRKEYDTATARTTAGMTTKLKI